MYYPLTLLFVNHDVSSNEIYAEEDSDGDN